MLYTIPSLVIRGIPYVPLILGYKKALLTRASYKRGILAKVIALIVVENKVNLLTKYSAINSSLLYTLIKAYYLILYYRVELLDTSKPLLLTIIRASTSIFSSTLNANLRGSRARVERIILSIKIRTRPLAYIILYYLLKKVKLLSRKKTLER
ncbi:hypothetical protein P153DRAFT_360821 [Dothidotthia symphoricarpi CBS 119687]|uniref:Uncharacterized protein n=1 Tax=Dothidotthia symphoricarpi CBS 119687 TaxID=1392245 RepID=A0A6A6A0D8_9PLEO|nr:uncharacterized protein P153DRAFT_360821 [Dothidotthia symphoricarpi CBS 119687]KAF2124614.1 hypothetical protein P153DRAFT_360821 [Dothidotthia symphoricarpi CBS 119687]